MELNAEKMVGKNSCEWAQGGGWGSCWTQLALTLFHLFIPARHPANECHGFPRKLHEKLLREKQNPILCWWKKDKRPDHLAPGCCREPSRSIFSDRQAHSRHTEYKRVRPRKSTCGLELIFNPEFWQLSHIEDSMRPSPVTYISSDFTTQNFWEKIMICSGLLGYTEIISLTNA